MTVLVAAAASCLAPHSSMPSPGDEGTLAQDLEDDDVPLVCFTARRSGIHLLTLTMADSNTEFYYFGFRMLAK